MSMPYLLSYPKPAYAVNLVERYRHNQCGSDCGYSNEQWLNLLKEGDRVRGQLMTIMDGADGTLVGGSGADNNVVMQHHLTITYMVTDYLLLWSHIQQELLHHRTSWTMRMPRSDDVDDPLRGKFFAWFGSASLRYSQNSGVHNIETRDISVRFETLMTMVTAVLAYLNYSSMLQNCSNIENNESMAQQAMLRAVDIMWLACEQRRQFELAYSAESQVAELDPRILRGLYCWCAARLQYSLLQPLTAHYKLQQVYNIHEHQHVMLCASLGVLQNMTQALVGANSHGDDKPQTALAVITCVEANSLRAQVMIQKASILLQEYERDDGDSVGGATNNNNNNNNGDHVSGGVTTPNAHALGMTPLVALSPLLGIPGHAHASPMTLADPYANTQESDAHDRAHEHLLQSAHQLLVCAAHHLRRGDSALRRQEPYSAAMCRQQREQLMHHIRTLLQHVSYHADVRSVPLDDVDWCVTHQHLLTQLFRDDHATPCPVDLIQDSLAKLRQSLGLPQHPSYIMHQTGAGAAATATQRTSKHALPDIRESPLRRLFEYKLRAPVAATAAPVAMQPPHVAVVATTVAKEQPLRAPINRMPPTLVVLPSVQIVSTSYNSVDGATTMSAAAAADTAQDPPLLQDMTPLAPDVTVTLEPPPIDQSTDDALRAVMLSCMLPQVPDQPPAQPHVHTPTTPVTLPT